MPGSRAQCVIGVTNSGERQERDAPIYSREDAVIPFATCCCRHKRPTDERRRADATFPLQDTDKQNHWSQPATSCI